MQLVTRYSLFTNNYHIDRLFLKMKERSRTIQEFFDTLNKYTLKLRTWNYV